MANYGILKYTCTVDRDTAWGNWNNFHMTTQDLPISDYEILEWTVTAPATLTKVYAAEAQEVSDTFGAIIGKRKAGSTRLWDWFKEDGVPFTVDYDVSDEGKTFQLVIRGGGEMWNSTSGPDVNTLDTLEILEELGAGDADWDMLAGSVITLEIRHTGKSACFPPTSVTAPSYIHYHGGIRVAWNTAESGNKNPVSGYEVWRSRTRNGARTCSSARTRTCTCCRTRTRTRAAA